MMRRRRNACGKLVLAVWLVLSAVACRQMPEKTFSGSRALQHAKAQCALGARPVGSPANRKTADYIARVLKENGWQVEFQDFSYLGVAVRNVIGKKGQGPVTILGAHFDTRPLADRDPTDRTQPVLGANDGASGVAVLLELSRVLGSGNAVQGQTWLAFFDGEDHGDLNDWPFCVGSQYMAENLSKDGQTPIPEGRPRAVLVVDMVGRPEQHFGYEWTSSLALQEKVWRVAKARGYAAYFVPEHRYAVYDDHAPFAQLGIPSAVLIGFDDPDWHTRQDTLDKISADSLQRVGVVLQTWLEGEPPAASADPSANP
jgi:glutaminyl-peptide cyclotransferase